MADGRGVAATLVGTGGPDRSPDFLANAVESVADVLEETAEKIRPGADVAETIDVLTTNAGLLRALAPSIRAAGAGFDRLVELCGIREGASVALVKVEGGRPTCVVSRRIGPGESFLAAAGRLYEEEGARDNTGVISGERRA